MQRCNEYVLKKGIKMNAENTVILTLSRAEEQEFSNAVGDKMMKNINISKYLGGIVNKEGGEKRDVSYTIKKFSASAGALWPVIKERYVPLKVKKIIFNYVMTPTVIYGLESWVMTVKDRNKFQAAEMKPLMAMIGKTRRDRVRNKNLRKTIGVCSMLNKIDAAHLRWQGVARQSQMDEDADPPDRRKAYFWELK